MAAPILTTKLYIPAARPELVPRPRLIERLNASLRAACKLILVSAPPGFGKTTLLGAWVSERMKAEGGRMKLYPSSFTQSAHPFKIAWLSLDENDNDPTRFLAYVIAALQTIEADLGQALLSALESPQAPKREDLVTALINEIDALAAPVILVLDDYHLVTAQAVHDLVDFFLDHLPGNLRLVIATRSDPPLRLARLRARDQLIELRQTDLRFTAGEAAEFVTHIVPVEFSAQDVAALNARAEGWVAGLQMAALALKAHMPQAQGDVADFIQAFTGSNRYILDYLAEEVLQRQPEGIQSFLLQTCLLERMTGPLCDVVTGRNDGQAMLEALDKANLFIVALDDERQWYRYHRLLADLLLKRLVQSQPDLAPALHRRASVWYEQNGYTNEAIEHALSAQDKERAARLVEQAAEAVLMSSQVATVLNWIDRLPEEAVRARPDLCILHAWVLLIGGRPLDRVESRLRGVDTRAPSLKSKVALVRAYIAALQGRMAETAELARQALEQLPAHEQFMRVSAAWLLSNTYAASGDFASARQAFHELVSASLQAGYILIAAGALCNLAEVHLRLAQLRQARAAYERALAVATDARGRRLPVAGKALLGLSDVYREMNDLEAAMHCALEGIELARLWSWPSAIMGHTFLARIKQSQGDMPGANQALETARRLAAQYDMTDVDDVGVSVYGAYVMLAQGDHAAARQWAVERKLDGDLDPAELDRRDDYVSFHMRKYEYLVLARLLIAQARPGQALAVLEPLLARMRQQGRTRLVVEALAIMALAWQAQGKQAQAREALEQSLELAEPGGYVRLFLDEGQPMRRLIQDCRLGMEKQAQSGPLARYADQLLAAFSASTPVPPAQSAISNQQSKIPNLVEPLSERELQVLRLLSAGLSNPDIAEELSVAVSTVRSHVKSIYGKLNVHGRWEAVQRAQELNLVKAV